MKIYITPFIALVAANNGRIKDVSAAAAAADTAAVDRSHPHLRALTDVVVAIPCDGPRECKFDNQCGGRFCSWSGGNSCGVCCPDSTCNSAGNGCPDDGSASCDTSAASVTYPGCYECRSDVTPSMIEQVEADEEVDTVDNEDGKQGNTLRASILEEE